MGANNQIDMDYFGTHPLDYPTNGKTNSHGSGTGNGHLPVDGGRDLRKLLDGGLRIALVQDALPFIGGAEKPAPGCLGALPAGAPVYADLQPEGLRRDELRRETHLQLFPRPAAGCQAQPPQLLPLYPLAIERFDLRAYDLVLSFSYAVAHGVLVRPDQLHVSLVHTPLRYAWHFYHEYLNEAGLRSGPKGWLAQLVLLYLRMWDCSAASRTDSFVAISEWVARCVRRAYRRHAR